MGIRAFYWDSPDKVTDRRASFLPKKRTSWRAGNVGDIFNRDLITHLYGEQAINVQNEGHKFLLVGSVVHAARDGDIIAGAGTKGALQPDGTGRDIRVIGVRGPKTADVLKSSGYDVSKLKFMLDPGMLIADIYPEVRAIVPEAGSVAFIPHYRERPRYRSTKKYDVLDVDATPREFILHLAKYETIYSSSLHGVIFAHAIGRPAVLVAPKTSEAEIKYRDYFASVGLKWEAPKSIEDSLRFVDPSLPENVRDLVATAEFPSVEELRERGIAV